MAGQTAAITQKNKQKGSMFSLSPATNEKGEQHFHFNIKLKILAEQKIWSPETSSSHYLAVKSQCQA